MRYSRNDAICEGLKINFHDCIYLTVLMSTAVLSLRFEVGGQIVVVTGYLII